MMDAWELPTCINVGGEDYKIRTDFRAVLDILKYFADPEYEPDEKWEICLDILYEDYANMPYNRRQEAAEKALEFIDMGIKDDGRRKPHTMDWEQDAPIIIPSVNRVLGSEVRAMEYLHWWRIWRSAKACSRRFCPSGRRKREGRNWRSMNRNSTAITRL